MASYSASDAGPRLTQILLDVQTFDLPSFRIVYPKLNIRTLLIDESSVGILFHLISQEAKEIRLIAVSVDENGKVLSEFLEASESTGPTRLTAEEAATKIKAASLNAFFSRKDIQIELDQPKSSGLAMGPGKLIQGSEDTLIAAGSEPIDQDGVFQTLSMVGTDDEDQSIIDLNDGFVLSAIPCPPKCPTDPDNFA